MCRNHVLVVDPFYIALFSDLEQTHCAGLIRPPSGQRFLADPDRMQSDPACLLGIVLIFVLFCFFLFYPPLFLFSLCLNAY